MSILRCTLVLLLTLPLLPLPVFSVPEPEAAEPEPVAVEPEPEAVEPEPAQAEPVPVAVEAVPPVIDPLDNAALFYWQASALMRQPLSEEQVGTFRFLKRDLLSYPPQVFLLRTDVSHLLIEESPVREALGLGALRDHCLFYQGKGDTPMRSLPHLQILDNLIDRGLGMALVYEYVRNDLGSAEIIRDLFQVCAHLDQDRAMRSLLAGASLTQKTVLGLEGFFSRNPSLQSCEVLSTYFKEHPAPLYHPAPVLKDEARRFAAWLNTRPGQAEERLLSLYKDKDTRTALDLLATLDGERKARRLQDWITGYKVHLFALAGALEQPYSEGLAAVRALDQRSLALQERGENAEYNPLFELLVPQVEMLHDRLTLAEAHWCCAVVLAEAARYRALVGQWPDALSSLEAFVGRPLPRDPFTGVPFHYSLKSGAPRLVIRTPKWIAHDGALAYSFNLAERRKNDNLALQELNTFMQQQAQEDARRAVREPAP